MTEGTPWARIEQLFNEALAIPESERDAWLDARCASDTALRAEVASLLASDRQAAGSSIDSQVKRAIVEFGAAAHTSVEGRRFGPYRLIRELGRGGMGAVYLAIRDDQEYEAEVAIKIVRPGLDTDFILRRFRRERQILARLQHPNIARLLDGGTEDGIPYLVMEYIRGSWITRYASEKRLSLRDRLRLFLHVCAAVSHAHRNFIVHRDLKPGNILIDENGIPKLLDFGVSKLLLSNPIDSSETQTVPMLTPAYASPEQVVGEAVTIVSDVYSLGVVLYELLTGVMAHRIEQRTPLTLERAICLEPTVAPSAAVVDDPELARQLKGDLDNIILHAMQKQPERRYASVEQLALDIQRQLDNLPVTATADSSDLATAYSRVAELEKALEEAKRIAAQLEAREKWKA
jgi:eukaryotic-like serine/threonine-protein kinase